MNDSTAGTVQFSQLNHGLYERLLQNELGPILQRSLCKLGAAYHSVLHGTAAYHSVQQRATAYSDCSQSVLSLMWVSGNHTLRCKHVSYSSQA